MQIFSVFIDEILLWKPQDNSFDSKLTYIHNYKTAVKFEENYLKQDIVSFTHWNVVNPFIVYEFDIWSHDLHTEFTLLELLSWPLIPTLISILILGMVLDSIHDQFFIFKFSFWFS